MATKKSPPKKQPWTLDGTGARLWLVGFLIVFSSIARASAQTSAPVEPRLGPAPRAPLEVSGAPGATPRKLDLTPALNVNTFSREETREFYNAVYPASEGIPIDSTAVLADCDPGANSSAFQTAELLRINWFRAMSGIPAAVTLSAPEGVQDQSAALMVSVNNQLAHDIPTNWICFDSGGAAAAEVSDLALGINGPDAITGYMWDYGSENAAVPHRRWLLYPQTQTMGVGDVPAQGAYLAANATYIYDTNFDGPRPPNAPPFVSWPPPGFAPFAVVYPQWSFGLSNADFSAATVSMQSNGVPMNVNIQPFSNGYGENTLVWYPANLNPNNYGTLFPFDGADTVYSISVSNVMTGSGLRNFAYDVTVFDPAIPGADYVPTVVNGTNNPSIGENNPYSCTASGNPNITGYQWVVASTANGDLSDNALNGLTNFIVSPPPIYSIITNPPVGTGKCFHLTHTNAAPLFLQFSEVLYPDTNTSLSFRSLLGYATSNEVARVQCSTNGGQNWLDLFAQAGTGGAGQTAFASQTVSLASCAGQVTSVRFNYDYLGGLYFNQTAPNIGWCIERIVVTNAAKLANIATNLTGSTNFNFVPSAAGVWVLEARGIIFGQYGLDWSAPAQVVAVTNAAPTVLMLDSPEFISGQAQIAFTLLQGGVSSLALLQADQLNGPWTTNSAAVLTTIAPGSSFQFTAPFPGATTFYRVLAK